MENKGVSLAFFNQKADFLVVAKQSGKLSARQLFTLKKSLRSKVLKKGKVFIKVFPNFSATSKGVGIRIGKGKGNVEYWVDLIQPNLLAYCKLVQVSLKSYLSFFYLTISFKNLNTFLLLFCFKLIFVYYYSSSSLS